MKISLELFYLTVSICIFSFLYLAFASRRIVQNIDKLDFTEKLSEFKKNFSILIGIIGIGALNFNTLAILDCFSLDIFIKYILVLTLMFIGCIFLLRYIRRASTYQQAPNDLKDLKKPETKEKLKKLREQFFIEDSGYVEFILEQIIFRSLTLILGIAFVKYYGKHVNFQGISVSYGYLIYISVGVVITCLLGAITVMPQIITKTLRILFKNVIYDALNSLNTNEDEENSEDNNNSCRIRYPIFLFTTPSTDCNLAPQNETVPCIHYHYRIKICNYLSYGRGTSNRRHHLHRHRHTKK